MAMASAPSAVDPRDDGADPYGSSWPRELRWQLRRFIASYRPEEGTAQMILRLDDGRVVVVTRAEVSTLMRATLHARSRRILELHYEQGVRREDVCARLHISIKTYERYGRQAILLLLDRIINGPAEGAHA